MVPSDTSTVEAAIPLSALASARHTVSSAHAATLAARMACHTIAVNTAILAVTLAEHLLTGLLKALGTLICAVANVTATVVVCNASATDAAVLGDADAGVKARNFLVFAHRFSLVVK